MESELTSALDSNSKEGEDVSTKKDGREVLVQFVRSADFSVRATNVLLQNCSSLEELNALNEELLLAFQNCGRKTVNEILNFLAQEHSSGALEPLPSIKEQLSASAEGYSLALLPLFSSKELEDVSVSDLHQGFQAFTKLSDLVISNRTKNVLDVLEMETIGEVMLVSGSALLKTKNFGKKSLNELKGIAHALCLGVDQENDLNSVDYSGYEKMVASFIGQCVKSERDQKLFMQRFCFLEGKVPTLEELGQQFGITRERARQILKKGLDKLRVKVNLDRLNSFWQQLDHLVVRGGGLIKLGTLATVLQKELDWSVAPYSRALGQFLLLKEADAVFKEDDDLLEISCDCLSCDLPGQQLQDFDFEATESFHIQVVAARLSDQCQKGCPWQEPVSTFHRAFIERLVTESNGRLMLHGDLVLSHNRWQGKYCENLEEVVCHVLENNGEPMHFREIADGVRRGNKKFVDSSDHNVHAAVMRYDSIEIIDRGTYGLKSWGLGGYRSVSTAIEKLLDEKGMPLKRQDILHHLQGEFSEFNISTSLTAETRFTTIGGGFYDRPLNWQQRSCQDFIKLLPESVADLARYLVSRNNTSYKLVMAFIFIRSMDEEGAIYLYKLRDMFYNFYLSRHKKGLVVELDTAVMSRIAELAPADMKNKAFPKPLESFLNSNFFQEFSRNGARLRLTSTLISDLRQGTTRDTLLITILKAIGNYFLKISPAPIPVDMSHHEVAEPRQDFHQSKSDDEPKQQAPTISIKKKGRGKIKL
jgi:hypothetical protein